MSDDYPAFALSEEHEALREAVRALADDKIAPRAAEIDRTSDFPWDVYEALVKSDLQAVHIPVAYSGAGADAIATAIVIEEVARACASSSLIPAVNKLGTMPLILGASEEVKARYLAPVARGGRCRVHGCWAPAASTGNVAYVTDPHKWVIHGERLVDDTPHIRVSLADVELPKVVRERRSRALPKGHDHAIHF